MATLSLHQLAGQHYLLTRQQSQEMRKLLGIQGIPFYALIDAKGILIEKGNHLRPLFAKQKIEYMLEQ